MSLETTNISDLPNNNQTSINNVMPPAMREKNEIIHNSNYNQVMSQCMKEVDPHDSNQMRLPSRDIPINMEKRNDLETMPDYVPNNKKDVIGNVKKVRFNEPIVKKEMDENLILVAISSSIFLLLSLPFFKDYYIKGVKKVIPSLVQTDGNMSLMGNVVYSLVFAGIFYFIIQTVDYSSLNLAF